MPAPVARASHAILSVNPEVCAVDVPNASIWLLFLTALLNFLSASVDLSKKSPVFLY
jgi:hypothetical protein